MNEKPFNELVRNLLVFLKGQPPALAAAKTKEDAMRQIINAAAFISSLVVRLEGAAYADRQETNDALRLSNELNELKQTNARLEESLFLEMNKTQGLSDKLARANENGFEAVQAKNALEEKLQELKQDFEKQYKDLSDSYRAVKAEQSSSEKPDKEEYNALLARLTEAEGKLGGANKELSALKQTLQKKETELVNSQEALLEALKMDKSEINALKQQLKDAEELKDENTALKESLQKANKLVDSMPSRAEQLKLRAEYESRLEAIKQRLKETQNDLDALRAQNAKINAKALSAENGLLKGRVSELEGALKSIITTRNGSAQNDKFAFTPEECAILFDVLSSAANRLASSLENRDIYLKANEAIALLEKTKAVEKIPSVGAIYNPKLHRAAKAFICPFLPDGMIIKETSSGYIAQSCIIQKAVVWVSKAEFVCTECFNRCRPHEYFCPKCGLELTAPNGVSKRELQNLPTNAETARALLDKLIEQANYTSANALLDYLIENNPNLTGLLQQKRLLKLSIKATAPNTEREPTPNEL